jgi:ribosomal protein S18 acetylase RimI-like enzyme
MLVEIIETWDREKRIVNSSSAKLEGWIGWCKIYFMTPDIQPDNPHVRPIRLRKDLSRIADLVELCFADHMDAEGRTYLHHIRKAGSDANSYYLDARSPETSTIPFHGYVWEENGQIIGNITLIYLKKNNQALYFIANVAVSPEHRNQGIAKELTLRAMQHVKEHDGKSVVLQVREDNPTAIHIYESLGFYEINRRTNWVPGEKIVDKKALSSNVEVTHRKSEDWSQQKLWLQDTYPENVAWFLPFQLSKHEPGIWKTLMRWLDSEFIRFWSAREGERLLGLATLETINPFQDYIWIASSLAFEEKAILALVPFVLKKVKKPQKIQINYPAHRAVDAFTQAGLKELNTLIWMENQLANLS